MSTMERLNNYSRALAKWAEKKRRYDLAIENKRPEKKPLEGEPMPSRFEIFGAEMEWAEKIRRNVLKLDVKKIKMPIRKAL